MKLFYSLLLLLFNSLAFAQPGGLDKTYNADFGLGSKIGASARVSFAGKQSDGSIIVSGVAVEGSETIEGITTDVARYNPDGTIDKTFARVQLQAQFLTRMVVQPDDKVIITGEIENGNIIRLNANGTIDQTFKTNIGTGSTSTVSDGDVIFGMALQPDGKIIVTGRFTKFNGVSRPGIARLNSNGTLDNTFSPGEGPQDGVADGIAFQSTGKIIIAGSFTSYDGTTRNGLARLNDDGSLDASFNPTGFDGGIGGISDILVTSNDQLIIAGSFIVFSGASYGRLVKTNADGSVDPNFHSPFTTDDGIEDLEFYGSDKIIVAGSLKTTPTKGLAKLSLATGANDASPQGFKVNNITTDDISTVVVQDDGKLFVGGGFTTIDGTKRQFVARLLADATLEGGLGANNNVNSIIHVGNGSTLIAGDFTFFRGHELNRVALVTPDGTLDASFDPAQGADGTINAIAKDANGKFIIAGNFMQYRGVNRTRIARINSDGTLDNTFDPGLSANGIIRSVAIQSDGSILIGGDFTAYRGVIRSHIARILTNGNNDGTFNPGTGADGSIRTIAIQSTGKIIAAGSFANFNGTSRKNIARINADGSLDNTFDPAAGPDGIIFVVKSDANNNVYIGGNFTQFTGTDRKGIARLTSTGTLDGTFVPDVDYSTVRTITLTNNGRVFVGGEFAKRIAMLSTAGVTDQKYFANLPPNDNVLTSVEDNNGLIIVGGQFTTYDGINDFRLARIPNTGKRDQTITFDAAQADNGLVFTGNPDYTMTATSTSGLPVTFSTDGNKLTITGNSVKVVHGGSATITAHQAGNDEYNPAPDVVRPVEIQKGTQEVFFELPNNNSIMGPVGYQMDLTSYAYSLRDNTLPIVFSVENTAIATISADGKKLVIVSGGSTDVIARQPGNDDWQSAGTDIFINVTINNTAPGTVTGLEDDTHQLIVYPNPTEGPLTIQLPESHTGLAEATVISSLGVTMAAKSEQAGHDLKLDLSSLPKGIYLVRIQSGSINTVKRVHRK